MIINCINCNKKFEVNASLIPANGRTIQCGSCHHVWFYTPETTIKSDFQSSKVDEGNYQFSKTDEYNNIELNEKENNDKLINAQKQNEIIIPKKEFSNKASAKKDLNDQKVIFNFSKFLSYILVFLISFIGLIIILDTFRSPISNYFPDLEIFLYNLFESIKDVYLFIENLLI